MNKNKYETLDIYYEDVKDFIDCMRKANFIEDAKQINDIVFETAYTTGSELLGELMLKIESLLKNKYPEAISKRMKDIHYFAKNHRKIIKLD